MNDSIDLGTVTIINAPADITIWNKTASISEVKFQSGVTSVEFTKKNGPDRWPDVIPVGWDGPLQYTLWLFRQISGKWYGSAFIQFWNNRPGSGSASDPDVPSLYDKHWFYSSRWAPIFGSGPIKPGESIGFMVTSGNQRDNGGPNSVRERSNVVLFPATDSGIFAFPVNEPVPGPVPAPTPAPIPDLSRIEAKIDKLLDILANIQAPLYQGKVFGSNVTLFPKKP